MNDKQPQVTEPLESSNQAEQIALLHGKPVMELPKDLYIPPEALEVILEAFQGPLDLLLYLIKRQNLDILDIPVADITKQYVEYVELMKELQLELAAEYLLMAAMLAEIKSRMLLPRQNEVQDEEHDPRAELIRRLQEYERFKAAAQQIDELPRMHRDVFHCNVEAPELEFEKPLADVQLKEIILAFKDVLRRAQLTASHHIQREPLSMRERMSTVLARLQQNQFVEFHQLFNLEEGRGGVVVSFIAILELIKQSLIEIVQAEPFSSIHIKAVSA